MRGDEWLYIGGMEGERGDDRGGRTWAPRGVKRHMENRSPEGRCGMADIPPLWIKWTVGDRSPAGACRLYIPE